MRKVKCELVGIFAAIGSPSDLMSSQVQGSAGERPSSESGADHAPEWWTSTNRQDLLLNGQGALFLDDALNQNVRRPAHLGEIESAAAGGVTVSDGGGAEMTTFRAMRNACGRAYTPSGTPRVALARCRVALDAALRSLDEMQVRRYGRFAMAVLGWARLLACDERAATVYTWVCCADGGGGDGAAILCAEWRAKAVGGEKVVLRGFTLMTDNLSATLTRAATLAGGAGGEAVVRYTLIAPIGVVRVVERGRRDGVGCVGVGGSGMMGGGGGYMLLPGVVCKVTTQR